MVKDGRSGRSSPTVRNQCAVCKIRSVTVPSFQPSARHHRRHPHAEQDQMCGRNKEPWPRGLGRHGCCPSVTGYFPELSTRRSVAAITSDTLPYCTVRLAVDQIGILDVGLIVRVLRLGDLVITSPDLPMNSDALGPDR